MVRQWQWHLYRLPNIPQVFPLVALLRFPSVREKEKGLESPFLCEGHFSHQRYYVANPNDRDMKKWVPNLVFKFHEYPTVNEFEIIVLLEQVEFMWEKRVLGEEEGKTNLRGRECCLYIYIVVVSYSYGNATFSTNRLRLVSLC